MVKPGSQRQKEYLQRLKDKNRDEYLEKEKKEQKSSCGWKPQTSSITTKYKNTKRKKLQRAIRRQQAWMCFFELANVKGTLCDFQQR